MRESSESGVSCTESKQTMGEIVDKTKGKIKQAVGDPSGNKRRKGEGERDERQANSKAR